MTENAPEKGMEPFENPDLLPLNELKLTVKRDGITEAVNALNKRWAEDRYFLHYEVPNIYNEDGSEIMGAKEHWMEIVSYLIDDVKWLLGLPFYRFWSNVVFNTSILDALVSFLQEAPPFYAVENFPNCPDMLDLLETLRHLVLLVFARLVTNKESPAEYMERPFLGRLLYENYIFTVPIIFDLCQLYGRENAKVVEKILGSLFALEPSYNDDLRKSVACLIEAFNNVEAKFNVYAVPETNEARSVVKGQPEITLFQVEDMILYMLDISSTVAVLLKNLPSVIHIFHREDFMNKIASVYESTIPKMYERLNALAFNDDDMPKFIELKHRLDVIRVELLTLFRTIIHEPLLNAQKNYDALSEAELKRTVDEYISFLDNVISEREFITDYNQFYPVRCDLESLQNLCPEIDVMKCDYILQSMYAIIEETKAQTTNSYSSYEAVAGPSRGEEEEQPSASCSNATLTNGVTENPEKNPADVERLIFEVKDVLCHLGEGFIMECLKHYNYNGEAVINAVLEDTLPEKLKALDMTLPIIPPDPMEASAAVDAVLGAERLNVFDNDEFDVMTRDSIDMSRVILGKKKEKYRDINEMLNDKSDVKRTNDLYTKYTLITDDYNDEYDDTYNGQDRPFTVPRVLFGNPKRNAVSEEESSEEEEPAPAKQNGGDQFVQNPAELRAKAEERRQAARGGKGSGNVVGKPRGQGQDKEVLINRDQKGIHKATRANHNRRSAAQWKRRQGVIPS